MTFDIHSNNFNIIRLILSLLVGIYHWNILTEGYTTSLIFNLGEVAVDLFFIISGFLIFWSFSRDENYKSFYHKRFYRIFPIYFILIFLQTSFFIGFSNADFVEIFKYFISNLFFLNFLAPTVGDTLIHLDENVINGSLWTLKNEVTFYLLVPLIFIYYKKIGFKFLFILYTCSVGYLLVSNHFEIDKLMNLFPAQLRFFVVGICLYIFFDKITENVVLISVVIFTFLGLIFRYNEYFEYLFYPIMLGAFLYFILFYVKKTKIGFDFSYSFYILHYPVIQLILYFNLNPDNRVLSFIVIFSTVLYLSYLSEKHIEKRFIQLGRNMLKKKSNN